MQIKLHLDNPIYSSYYSNTIINSHLSTMCRHIVLYIVLCVNTCVLMCTTHKSKYIGCLPSNTYPNILLALVK